jgi:hypothetical protein
LDCTWDFDHILKCTKTLPSLLIKLQAEHLQNLSAIQPANVDISRAVIGVMGRPKFLVYMNGFLSQNPLGSQPAVD